MESTIETMTMGYPCPSRRPRTSVQVGGQSSPLAFQPISDLRVLLRASRRRRLGHVGQNSLVDLERYLPLYILSTNLVQ